MIYCQTNTHALRVALKYTKSNAARWLSHLDLIGTFERAIRRAELPILYSQGFNPRPGLSFGPALPLGATSDAEIAVVRLCSPMGEAEIQAQLNAQLPTGIDVVSVHAVSDSEPAIPVINGSSYLIRVVCRAAGPAEAVERAIHDFLAKDTVVLERMDRGVLKHVDVRRCVESLELVEANGEIVTLRVRISHAGERVAKPSEVALALSQIGPEITLLSLHREQLY